MLSPTFAAVPKPGIKSDIVDAASKAVPADLRRASFSLSVLYSHFLKSCSRVPTLPVPMPSAKSAILAAPEPKRSTRPLPVLRMLLPMPESTDSSKPVFFCVALAIASFASAMRLS